MGFKLLTELLIMGRPIAKKNSKRFSKKWIEAGFDKKGKFRPRRLGNIVIPSEAYGRFRDDVLVQIATQYHGLPIPGRFLLQLMIQQKGKIPIDFDNALSSILDILQQGKVIEDDKNLAWIFGGIIPGAKEWSCHVRIYAEDAELLKWASEMGLTLQSQITKVGPEKKS